MEVMIFARIFLLYCPEAKTTLIKKNQLNIGAKPIAQLQTFR